MAKVRVDPLLRIHGYRDPKRVQPAIRDVAETVAAMTDKLLTPEACYCRAPIERCTDGLLVLEGGTVFRSDAFVRFLGGCHEVIVFVLTVGAELDKVSQDLTNSDRMLEALFLETAGWLGVEAATKSLTEHLRMLLRKEGCGLTRRFGPGYTYTSGREDFEWALEDQKPLFALFDAVPPPVELLDSCAMIPKMSRSGLYGIRRKVTSR